MPVHNEEKTIPVLYHRLNACSKRDHGNNYELIFVDDGSTDRSLYVLKEFAKSDSRIQIIELTRNFGHQAAIRAGLDYTNGDLIITMDSDLQDPPELILELLKAWRSGYDVVHATRQTRKGETLFKTCSALLYYRILRLMGVDILADTGDFRLMTRSVLESLKEMPEKRLFLRGMIPWLGYKQGQVYYDRDPRFSGITKYSFNKMVRLAADGIFSFSDCMPKVPFAFAFIALALKQWSAAMTLISLGIIAEYALRIYDQVRGRPIYVRKFEDNKECTLKTMTRTPKKSKSF